MLTPGCTQTTARSLLKPSGFTLSETVKVRGALRDALRRHVPEKLHPYAESMLAGVITKVGYWVQFWRSGEQVRCAIIDPRTMVVLRVYEMAPNHEILFPPRGSSARDLVAGANL